ncbi:MAG: glutamyl-tRNA reductase, partial [Eubacteriaceae bacterium]
MQLAVAGISHINTPQNIREKAAFTRRRASEGMEKLLEEEMIDEVMILSTCNRSEIYAISENPQCAASVLSAFYMLKSPELKDYLYWKTGDEALKHLYKVASGFDSMILGEDQILGQTKDALTLAGETGASGKFLNKIVREAVTYAKKTKEKYAVSESPRSLSSTAVKKIMRMIPDYADKQVVIVGSGKMGLLTLRYMASEGFNHVTMTNRTYHEGDEYREIYRPLNVVPYHERYEVIRDADIVISATSSPHLVLRKNEMLARSKPLLLADLAMPRDIDPEIGNMEQTTLLSIDDFRHMFDESSRYLESVSDQVDAEIVGEVAAINEWIAGTRTDAITERLMAGVKERSDETIEILNGRYGFTGKDLKFLEKIIRSEFRKQVMPTVLRLKELEDPAQIQAIEKA